VTVPDRETIRVERDGALARITIDRPERFNSLEKCAAHFQGR
jgi:enoyl-CoA hydratase/carnithine racemase